MAAFDPCLSFTLKAEGGYGDNPKDPGRATNRGITEATLSDWRGKPCTADDVKALSLAETRAIYAARYWNAVQGDALPAGVDLMVFDHGVNAGPAASAKLLQAAVATVPDGHIGPLTIEAAGKRSPFLVITAIAEAQEAAYRGLPDFATFGRGWLNRLAARRTAAIALIAPAKPEPAAAPSGGWWSALVHLFAFFCRS